LGKVLVAAAWADHEVSHDEINSLKDLLFRLPELTGREWASLEMYIDSPVGESERERLIEQLKGMLRSSADKALALRAMDELVHADGVVSDEELVVVEAMKSEIERVDVTIFGQLGRLVSGSVSRREESLREAPNREEHFEDFIKNKVFYGLQRRLAREADEGEGLELEIPEQELRMLCLAGGLMARVAHVDLVLTDEEFRAITATLMDEWQLNQEQASFVAEVAISEVGPDMDYYRLSREFFEATDEPKRADFMKVLFKVAAADGEVSHQETEEIRAISNSLRLTHKRFIEAKLSVPS
jgi:uncharacterized tellurite resistance protein B-like protein